MSAPLSSAEHPEGVQLLKNGEEMLTPKRHPLVVPTETLAEKIIEEWTPSLSSPPHAGGMKDKNTPTACGGGKGGALKPLTQLAYTAIDLVLQGDDTLIEAMLAYLHTDSICYFAESPELAKRERKYWQPVIDWASERFDCELLTFEGIMPADQPGETAAILQNHIENLNPCQVACLLEFTRGFSSLLLGLAVLEGRLDAQTAFECSQVDEDFQREEWGADEEAMARREKLKAEMLAAERFLNLL